MQTLEDLAVGASLVVGSVLVAVWLLVGAGALARLVFDAVPTSLTLARLGVAWAAAGWAVVVLGNVARVVVRARHR